MDINHIFVFLVGVVTGLGLCVFVATMKLLQRIGEADE